MLCDEKLREMTKNPRPFLFFSHSLFSGRLPSYVCRFFDANIWGFFKFFSLLSIFFLLKQLMNLLPFPPPRFPTNYPISLKILILMGIWVNSSVAWETSILRFQKSWTQHFCVFYFKNWHAPRPPEVAPPSGLISCFATPKKFDHVGCF